MHRAAGAAQAHGVPIVLDPVGCGATALRTQASRSLLREARPALVRGNAAEIHALHSDAAATRGVDSHLQPEQVLDAALALSDAHACVVWVSGEMDQIVFDGQRAEVGNGHAMMTRVTGMGCTASALAGAFLAVSDSAYAGAINAAVTLGVAGELAARSCQGPGSFQVALLDALHNLDQGTIWQRLRLRPPRPAR
jgi:hydroxyethylthiazole kinase